MYGENIPAKFTTKKGSVYTVTTDSVTRQKYYDPYNPVTKAKNIYYTGYNRSEKCLEYFDICNTYTVHKGHGNEATITFYKGRDVIDTLELYCQPEEDLYPLDMFLNADGSMDATSAYKGGHHVGDRITKMM